MGQGVLYRHFPSRLALALEVFAENFEELERVIDTTPGPECFHTAWYLVVGYTVSSSAFVEMAIEARSDVPESLGSRRLERLLAEPLARAQQAGLIDPTWTPQDIVLLQRMVHGVVISEAETEAVPRAVRRALELVDASLVPPHWSQQRRAEPR